MQRTVSSILRLFLFLTVFVILIAILWPVEYSFKRSEAYRKAICQANMKEIGIAFRMYVDDNFDTLPSSAACGSSDREFRTTVGDLHEKPARTIFQLLYRYKNGDALYKCPSDPTRKSSYILRKAINQAWLDPSVAARHESDYKWPADQMLFYERGSYHWGNGNGDLSEGRITGSEPATVNVNWMDGHVKTVRVPLAPSPEPDYYNTDGKTGALVKAPQIDPRRYCDTLN